MEHHHHHHAPQLTTINRAFIVGIILNFGYVIFQVIVGFNINSLSLLSDAGHNLAKADLTLADIDALKHKIKHELEHQNIHHATLETELDNAKHEEVDC
jgi:Co/Zn/Cd efflux system component